MASLKKHILTVLCLCQLTACAINRPFDENSYFSSIPAGSVLVLKQPLEIGSDKVAVYMQDGKLLAYKLINHYLPHCKFELYAIASEPRTVQPDSFEITRVDDSTLMASLRPLPTASLNTASDGGGYMVTFSTIMYLRSALQPDVYRMTCMHWDETSESRFLTIGEMRKAMGGLFSLQINLTASSDHVEPS